MKYSRLAILVFAISACQEYTSHYPIGKPIESTIKSSLSGDWIFVSSINLSSNDSVDYGAHFMRITPFNSTEYLVQLVSDTLMGIQDINQFRGYSTVLDKVQFANISPINNEGKRPVFSIYKYALKGDSLIFNGISQEKFESLNTYVHSEGQHRKFIKSSLDNLDWWNMEYRYVKRGE